ncbi:hypothetical protein FWD07_00505 [Candidatus Saccharibacteria bacterium]|nr:hypothetical protein [Candidatus Saccharibacteria bacterium]
MIKRGTDGKKIVAINGRFYDMLTGQEIERRGSGDASTGIHGSVQKSQTLNRKFVKKVTVNPLKKPQTAQQQIAMDQFRKRLAVARKKNEEARQKILVARSKKVVAPVSTSGKLVGVERVTVTPPAQEEVMEVAQVPKNVQFANAVLAKKKAEMRHMTAMEMKERAIQQAFERERETNLQAMESKKKTRIGFFRNRKLVSVVSMCAAVLLLGGYLTYINMPNISIRVAAMRAGIDASHPSYRPQGYSLNGLVSFRNGAVEMEFTNGEGESFILTQQRSSWDSAALLQNFVRPNWGVGYTIAREQGMTIYLNDGNAAWVSGGVLYTIEGTGITNEQARNIATSL